MADNSKNKPNKPSRSSDGSPPRLTVVDRPISSLRAYARNARTHSKKQVAQIAASITEFGFTNPILVDENGEIVAGHGRLEAARLLAMSTVPAIVLSYLSNAQKKALRIADNKIAANAGWDLDLLRVEILELADPDLTFDLDILGFEPGEIDVLVDGAGDAAKADPADKVPSPMPKGATRVGDMWLLGKHRLTCGDALHPGTFARLMGEDRARLVFADPPYNVPIDGHVCGAGEIKHREFAMASGEMSWAEFTGFLSTVFQNLADVSIDGAVHYQCMDWRHMGEMIAAGETVYSKLLNVCVWAKDNGGMGSFYRSRHEMVFVWKVGEAPHLNNVELGKHGRNRTNVWEYAGVNTLKKDRMAELAMHPTVKPVALVVDAIKDASKRGDIVLDCFGGSGTTLIAAEKAGRVARLVELDPIYCDVIVKRWQQLTGGTARLEATGQSFAEVAAERVGEGEGEAVEGDSAVASSNLFAGSSVAANDDVEGAVPPTDAVRVEEAA